MRKWKLQHPSLLSAGSLHKGHCIVMQELCTNLPAMKEKGPLLKSEAEAEAVYCDTGIMLMDCLLCTAQTFLKICN